MKTSRAGALLGLLTAVALTQLASAATDTWSGNSGPKWNNAGNWTGGNAPPVAGDSLVFGTSGVTTLTNDFAPGMAFSSLTFSGSSAFTLNGAGILISGSTNSNNIGIVNNSATGQTIGTMPLTLDRGYYTFSSPAGGSIGLNGGLTVNTGGLAYFDANVSSTAFSLDGSGLIAGLGGAGLLYGTTASPASGPGPTSLATITGGIVTALTIYTPYASGAIASGQTLEFTANGASASLTAANGTTVNTISVDQAGNSGGTFTTTLAVAAAGTMTFTNNGGVYVLNSGAGTKGCFTLSSGSGGFITAGYGTSPASIIFAVNGDNAGNQASVSAVIKDNTVNGPVSVVVCGSGSVNINAVNSYSGGLYINQGQFQGNSASVGLGPIYVASGATAFLNGAGIYSNNVYISPGYGTLSQTTTNANPGAIFLSGSGAAGFIGKLNLLGSPVPVTSAGSVAGDRLTGGNVNNNNYAFAGQITGTGTLDFNSSIRSCNMILSNASVAAPNNWQGGLIIEESLATPTSARNCIVKLAADNQIPSGPGAGDVGLYSADTTSANSLVRLDLAGHNNTINGLYGAPPNNTFPVQISNFGQSNSVLTFGANNASGNFYGVANDNGVGKALSLVKIGAGTETFYAPLAHNGNTTISNGTLALTAFAAMSNTPVVAVASGALLDASGISGFAVGSLQTLAGLGTVKGKTVLNGKINPLLTTIGTLSNNGSVTANPGSTYVWDINSASGTAGADPGWGLLNITGGLVISSGFTVKVNSLTLADAPGPVADFNSATSYTWKIAHTTTGVTGLTAGAVAVDTGGFANSLAGGTFSLSTNATDLLLTFTAPFVITSIQVNTVGNTVSLSGSNGVAHAGYRVLSSTNVDGALNTWAQIGSGSFSNNGSFSFSGPINPADSQRYYVVVTP
jgi:autotransporter-associated beta strand protein